MAEFHFYGSAEDRQELLRQLLGSGYKLIPNRSYSDPTPDVVDRMSSELLRAIEVNKLLYVLGPFTLRPPFMTQLRRGEYKGRYTVDLSRGGPLLSLSLPGCSLEREVAKLTPGSLFHPREYWDDAIETASRPSQAVKEHFAAIKQLVTKGTLPRRAGRSIRIGPNGAQLFDAGLAAILADGRWITNPRAST
jgi:hypothetical protein